MAYLRMNFIYYINLGRSRDCRLIWLSVAVFCPGFQKGRVPSEKGTFSAVNGSTKGHH